MRNPHNPIIVALDGLLPDEAVSLVKSVGPYVHGFKLNDMLFHERVDEIVCEIHTQRCAFMLDAKLHDIPNTVRNQVSRLCKRFKPQYITVHASGGRKMVQAARQAALDSVVRPKILAVTVLTSLDGAEIDAVYGSQNDRNTVEELADRARDADGFVCAGSDLNSCWPEFPATFGERVLRTAYEFVVPGMRPEWYAQTDDQSRISTPADAMRRGATRLVVGRAITTSRNHAFAACKTASEVGYNLLLHDALTAGALEFGKFTLKSGRVSPYFFNLGRLFEYADRSYADRVVNLYHLHVAERFPTATMVCGPAYKGIPLVLSRTPFAFDSCVLRSEAKDHGEGGQFVFGQPREGDRVVILDDVITDGATKRRAVEAIRSTGAEVVGCVVAFDRGERSPASAHLDPQRTAIDMFTEDTGVPVASLATVHDLLPVARPEQRIAIEEYLKEYGA